MITSIGFRCFLQNWLYKKCKDDNLPYYENILSCIAAYPINWDIDIVGKYISNYDWFCEEFLNTCKVDNSEFISEQLGCRIHYSSKMNLQQMCDNLKQSDVVLVRLWKNKDTHTEMQYYLDCLNSIINKKFQLIGFTCNIDQDYISDGYRIVKIENTMDFDENERKYVSCWYVLYNDIQVLENVWNGIKQFA